jgi:hypothetical protein
MSQVLAAALEETRGAVTQTAGSDTPSLDDRTQAHA